MKKQLTEKEKMIKKIEELRKKIIEKNKMQTK